MFIFAQRATRLVLFMVNAGTFTFCYFPIRFCPAFYMSDVSLILHGMHSFFACELATGNTIFDSVTLISLPVIDTGC
jgi:hypothetical protein